MWLLIEIVAIIAICWTWYSFGKDSGYHKGYRAGIAAFLRQEEEGNDE